MTPNRAKTFLSYPDKHVKEITDAAITSLSASSLMELANGECLPYNNALFKVYNAGEPDRRHCRVFFYPHVRMGGQRWAQSPRVNATDDVVVVLASATRYKHFMMHHPELARAFAWALHHHADAQVAGGTVPFRTRQHLAPRHSAVFYTTVPIAAVVKHRANNKCYTEHCLVRFQLDTASTTLAEGKRTTGAARMAMSSARRATDFYCFTNLVTKRDGTAVAFQPFAPMSAIGAEDPDATKALFRLFRLCRKAEQAIGAVVAEKRLSWLASCLQPAGTLVELCQDASEMSVEELCHEAFPASVALQANLPLLVKEAAECRNLNLEKTVAYATRIAVSVAESVRSSRRRRRPADTMPPSEQPLVKKVRVASPVAPESSATVAAAAAAAAACVEATISALSASTKAALDAQTEEFMRMVCESEED